MFRSFAWGGLEAASHRRADGRRVDSVAASGHERWAMLDGAILRGLGVQTVREGFRWHLVGEGRRDWTSARAQIDAALANGLEVAWDICHWGVPDGIDIMAADWPARLADFAHDAARMLRREGCPVAAWVPVNEMAFWAWAGGETGGFNPFLFGQGDAMKRQLVRGHLAVVAALREAGATEPVMVCEPLIWVVGENEAEVIAARAFMDAAFDAVHWVLAENPSAVDVMGFNYYPQNQWALNSGQLSANDPRRRSLSSLLVEKALEFNMPLVISETGAEEPDGDAWITEVTREVKAARLAGVPVEGVCIYPATDYPGWDDDRHCPCGPIGWSDGLRFVRQAQAKALRDLQAMGQLPGGRLRHPLGLRSMTNPSAR